MLKDLGTGIRHTNQIISSRITPNPLNILVIVPITTKHIKVP